MIIVQGFHHIALIVSSESSVEFYKQLGFTETFRRERDSDTVVLMDGYGIELELFIDSNHPGRSKPEPLGLRHLAFKVNSCEQIKNNYDCSSINKDWFGKNYCFAVDPDGNTIEFHE